MANVSPATVSRVINDGPKVGLKTRKHVKQVMDQLGYRPNINARALVNKKSTSLGLVLAELMDPFFATYANAIEKIAREQNTQLLMSSGSSDADSERRAINTLLDHRVTAMIVHSKFLDDKELIEFANQVPGFVLINRYIEQIQDRCVWLDNTIGGYKMAEYLYNLGHREVAVVSSDFDIEDRRDRLTGVKQFFNEKNIPLSDTNIVFAAPNQQGGEIAMRQLLTSAVNYTAVITYNDAMASGVMNILHDNNLDVPNDVSVIGFDDVIIAQYCRPKLSTMNYPIEHMASNAANLALKFAAGEKFEVEPQHKFIPTIVARNSTAKL